MLWIYVSINVKMFKGGGIIGDKDWLKDYSLRVKYWKKEGLIKIKYVVLFCYYFVLIILF